LTTVRDASTRFQHQTFFEQFGRKSLFDPSKQGVRNRTRNPDLKGNDMKERTTQTLLAIVALLLLAHLVRPALTSSAQDIAPVLRGRALEIVDARGQVRARINVEPSTTMDDGKIYPESSVFRLIDPNGQIRVKLGADKDGSGLLLTDDSQQPGVHMLAKGTGSLLKLANKNGREQVIKP